MFQNIPLLPVIAALAVFIPYMIAMQLLGRKKKVRKRLDNIAGEAGGDDFDDNFIDSLRSDKETSASASAISSFLIKMGIDTETVRTENQLRFYQAGIQSPDAHIYYILFTRFLSFPLLVWAVYIASRVDTGLVEYAEAFLLGFSGLFGADMWIKNKLGKRQKILQRSFPDTLDLLLACAESGLALDGSLSRVCKELGHLHPEITSELNRTRIELSLLNDRSQALNNLAERNGLPSIRLFVTALLQSERFGTSLTETLRIMSEEYRNRRLAQAEEKAGRLPALMTLPLMLFLLPALFILILGPAWVGMKDVLK